MRGFLEPRSTLKYGRGRCRPSNKYIPILSTISATLSYFRRPYQKEKEKKERKKEREYNHIIENLTTFISFFYVSVHETIQICMISVRRCY